MRERREGEGEEYVRGGGRGGGGDRGDESGRVTRWKGRLNEGKSRDWKGERTFPQTTAYLLTEPSKSRGNLTWA